MYHCIWATDIFLKIFHLCSLGILACNFLFLFLWCFCLINVWSDFPCEAIQYWNSVCWDFFFFLITDSILMLIIGLHKLSLSDLVLEESMFLGIYWICCWTWHICSIFLWLYFCDISLSFLILFIWALFASFIATAFQNFFSASFEFVLNTITSVILLKVLHCTCHNPT